METAQAVAGKKGQQLVHGPQRLYVCIDGSGASIHLLSLPRSPSSAVWSWQFWHTHRDTHTHTILFTHHWLEQLILSGEWGVGQTKWKQARLIIYIRAGHRATEGRCIFSRSFNFSCTGQCYHLVVAITLCILFRFCKRRKQREMSLYSEGLFHSNDKKYLSLVRSSPKMVLRLQLH